MRVGHLYGIPLIYSLAAFPPPSAYPGCAWYFTRTRLRVQHKKYRMHRPQSTQERCDSEDVRRECPNCTQDVTCQDSHAPVQCVDIAVLYCTLCLARTQNQHSCPAPRYTILDCVYPPSFSLPSRSFPYPGSHIYSGWQCSSRTSAHVLKGEKVRWNRTGNCPLL